MIETLAGALGLSINDIAFWLPLLLAGLFFLCIAAGVVLDGFDIGVGCLLIIAPVSLRARMLSLLSPWRDANEFWLLVGLGLLLCAFPLAWSALMADFYGPLSMMGLGILLRTSAYELRMRSPEQWQSHWAWLFAIGSCLTALSHGLILAGLISSQAQGWAYFGLGIFCAFCVLAAYILLGASWLLMRNTGELRLRAVLWARHALRWVGAGIIAISVVLGLSNTGVFLKWGGGPHWMLIAVVWGVLLVCFITLEMILQRLINRSLPATLFPFLLAVIIILMVLCGLAYSFFPYWVLDTITIWDATPAPASLHLVSLAAILALPLAIVFNIWVYWGILGLSKAPSPPHFQEAKGK